MITGVNYSYSALVVDGLARTLCPALVNLRGLQPKGGRGQRKGMYTASFVNKETDTGGSIEGGERGYGCEGC